MSSRSFAFSTMVTTVAVVSVCACAWGQASQPSATVPKVASDASTKPPGKLKLLVWGTAKSEEEAQALLAEYNKAKVDWDSYLLVSQGYPHLMNASEVSGIDPGMRAVVLGVCPEKEAALLKDAFEPLWPGFFLADPRKEIRDASCPRPPQQRYLPSARWVEEGGKKLTGILFKAMIADDYTLIVVLRDENRSMRDRKDESGLCDKTRLSWDKDMEKLEFTGVCVTGLGTTLGTSKVKKVFSIENDKIAVAEESEVLTTPTIHD